MHRKSGTCLCGLPNHTGDCPMPEGADPVAWDTPPTCQNVAIWDGTRWACQDVFFGRADVCTHGTRGPRVAR